VKGDGEAEAGRKRRDKEGPRALEEYCRDLCAEVRAGRIDPVGGGLGGGLARVGARVWPRVGGRTCGAGTAAAGWRE
jgi:hypothetical protein